jgi:hypothetical protein
MDFRCRQCSGLYLYLSISGISLPGPVRERGGRLPRGSAPGLIADESLISALIAIACTVVELLAAK